ncbi:hypothetical protein FBEOM_11417 [Fusarium beomiforme]|uniref:MARVEL domain-containing protein n=1 Tax=Fusarium beomiforme TaxID=44412 RepID=A0A9P5DTE6_9HYPO|nr:hypothetical protein FBEOM_11417 [Fusarium beomiforme]
MAYYNNRAAPNDYGTTYNRRDETGLLTRWVPDRLKHSSLYRWFLRLTRVLQFLSAAISLGIFSARFHKVHNLVNAIKTHRGVNSYYGAVEGILAAAVLYTLVAMLMSLLLRGGGPRWLRWLWVLLDIAFVGAFIAVAVLTRPNGGRAGPRHCYRTEGFSRTFGTNADSSDHSCNLPWGTFILAIISTVLHAITAAFHEVRDRYKAHHVKEQHVQDAYGERNAAAPY